MKLLLHVCCGPDVTVALERLPQCEKLCLFFDNPNIHPEEEYRKRTGAFKRVADHFGIEYVIGEYDPEDWFDLVRGHEHDPEKGERCTICFRHRLERAALKAQERGFDTIGSVFTTSPHKDAALINATGTEIADNYGLKYLVSNFKKKDGFKRSAELSEKLGIYRQSYCGCQFSKREA
jgi:predicted adenine nucleotide alpha hydrolase (AANH) superfamily ATPase